MPFRPSLVPAVTPIAAVLAGLPFANRLEPTVLGLPFLLFWILAWVTVTPLFLAWAYALERRAERRDDAGAAGRSTR